MSLLPPAFKDPAFAPLGPPIKRRATFAQMREAYTEAQRYNALEDFECENHGNADTGCLQEGGDETGGDETAVTLVTKESVGRMITDLGRRALAGGAISYSNKGAITFDQGREMLDADVAHMRENRQITASALLRAGQKLDANLTPPSPELTFALNAAQAALAEHLFGETKKVKDPFEKMKAKANVMLQQAMSYPTWNDALARKLLEADAERVCNPSVIVPF